MAHKHRHWRRRRWYGTPEQWQDALGPDLAEELIRWAHAEPKVPSKARARNGKGKGRKHRKVR
jgi:hypothetical protein